MIMPLSIIRDDISTFRCDAIVNSTSSDLVPGGGADWAIHAAAGPGLAAECAAIGHLDIAQAAATGAHRLPCRHVIHIHAPIWRGGDHRERELLAECYDSALALAASLGCRSVAFPLIGSGAYCFPRGDAITIAVDRIASFLVDHEMHVTIVVFDKASYTLSERLFGAVQQYIDDNYEGELHYGHNDAQLTRFIRDSAPTMRPIDMRVLEEEEALSLDDDLLCDAMPCAPSAAPKMKALDMSVLDKAVHDLDESFSQMLLRKIAELGMTEPECYKRANIDAKHFSKIRSKVGYRPKKETAVALAIALRLSPTEARELLAKAGFAISRSNIFDVVIDYFLTNGRYDIFEINEVLFHFDQKLLGV